MKTKIVSMGAGEWSLVVETLAATIGGSTLIAEFRFESEDEAFAAQRAIDKGYLVTAEEVEISEAASTLGKRGGSALSELKAAASRRNGALGGRPKRSGGAG